MENIIKSFTLRKRATILLLFVLVICGYFSYIAIPKEDCPDVKDKDRKIDSFVEWIESKMSKQKGGKRRTKRNRKRKTRNRKSGKRKSKKTKRRNRK